MASVSITGLPMGGKSLYALHELYRLLSEDKRIIVTNLKVRFDNLQRWALKQGRDDINVYERVRFLEYDETSAFWRYRGGPNAVDLGEASTVALAKEWAEKVRTLGIEHFPNGIVLPSAPEGKQYSAEWLNIVLEAACPVGGIIFLIDEMHEHLNARNWQKHGTVASDYIAIHRHMSDDFFWITQAPNLVDSAFRVRTQEWNYVENTEKQMMLGFINRGGVRPFVVRSYLEQVRPGVQQMPQWTKKFSLDPEFANCYETSRFGGQADKGTKKKGIHFYWIWPLALGAVVLVFVAMLVIPQSIGRLIFGAPPKMDGLNEKSSAIVKLPSSVSPVFQSAPVVLHQRILGRSSDMLVTDRDVYRVGAISSQGLVESISESGAFCSQGSRRILVSGDGSGQVESVVRQSAEGSACFVSAGQERFVVLSEGYLYYEGASICGVVVVSVTKEKAVLRAAGSDTLRYVYFDWQASGKAPVLSGSTSFVGQTGKSPFDPARSIPSKL